MNVLIVIPESGFCPPQGGGALRVFHLLRELGRHFEVHAVTGQSARSLETAAASWELPQGIRFHSPVENPPPLAGFRTLPPNLARALSYRWQRRNPRGPACGVFLDMAHLVRAILAEHPIDVVVFEHLEAMTLSPLVRRLQPRALRVLDAHNLDHRLAEQAAEREPGNPRLRREAQRLRNIESTLASEVDAVLACSDADRDSFVALNRGKVPAFTIPNGVDTLACLFDGAEEKRGHDRLLFCGSLDYAPNADGLVWFHREIWPRLRETAPDLRLRVVGRGRRTDAWSGALRSDPAVEWIGEVPEVAPHYAESVACIVPLREGSGTRLKILEAMAFGTPVVSTRIGAEGIDAVDGEHLVLADEPEDFAKRTAHLLADEKEYEVIRVKARRLVEERYDWRVVGEGIARALHGLTHLQQGREEGNRENHFEE